MASEKNEDKERELDSFLKSAQESRRRPDRDDWYAAPHGGNKKSNLTGVVLIVGLIALIAILLFAVKEMKGIKGTSVERIIERGNVANSSNDSLKLDQGKYQAVFLTNGQVYFGKVNSHDESYIELVDIYYLQVKPVLQQGEEGNANDNKNAQNQKTELSLVKLGNELHGPLDRMMLNKDQVVFIEDLKSDSKVTDAINRYKQQGQKQ